MSIRLRIVALACLALTACVASAPPVRVDKADVDLTNCRTFDWLAASEDAASLTEQRVRAAVLRELERKGYAHSSDQPDCRITYLSSVHERPPQKPRVGVGVGGGSRGVGGGVGVSLPVGRGPGHVGEFTLDVIDVATNSQIWRGSVDAAFEAAEPTEEEVQDLVRIVLAEFPDRASSQ